MSGICALWILARLLSSNPCCGHIHQQNVGKQPDFNSLTVKVDENDHLIKSLGKGWGLWLAHSLLSMPSGPSNWVDFQSHILNIPNAVKLLSHVLALVHTISNITIFCHLSQNLLQHIFAWILVKFARQTRQSNLAQ